MPISVSCCQSSGRVYTDDLHRAAATKVFRLRSDTKITDLSDLIGTPGLPDLDTAYNAFYPLLRVSSVEFEEASSRDNYEYVARVQYETTSFGIWTVRTNSQSVDTVLERTMNDFTGVNHPQRFTDEPTKYLASKPSGLLKEDVINRARDYFDPPIMTSRRQLVITASIMVHNVSEIASYLETEGELLNYIDKINSLPLSIFGVPGLAKDGEPWTFLIDDIILTSLARADGSGCDLQVEMRIIYDPLGHCKVVLNAGYNELYSNGGVLKPRKCLDSSGAEKNSPSLLDADGVMLPPTAAGTPPASTYIVFPDKEALNIKSLELPTDFCSIVIPTDGP